MYFKICSTKLFQKKRSSGIYITEERTEKNKLHCLILIDVYHEKIHLVKKSKLTNGSVNQIAITRNN